VAIDVDVGLRRMAPFVSPLVEGKMVESRKYQTNTFKPATSKIYARQTSQTHSPSDW
jgi:hypothetical protein